MAKLRVRSNKKVVVGGILKLKVVFEKLQRTLLLGRRNKSSGSGDDAAASVPNDVKEGHFAVIAEDGDETKRFVVPLRCLTNPAFLRLLEQSAEEYGFDRDGALIIPCGLNELEMLLARPINGSRKREPLKLPGIS